MPRPRTTARLTKHEVSLIVEMLHWSRRRGLRVADAVEQRLAENEVDLRGYRHELLAARSPITAKMLKIVCERLEQDSRRIERLMGMFASWRVDEPSKATRPELGSHE